MGQNSSLKILALVLGNCKMLYNRQVVYYKQHTTAILDKLHVSHIIEEEKYGFVVFLMSERTVLICLRLGKQ